MSIRYVHDTSSSIRTTSGWLAPRGLSIRFVLSEVRVVLLSNSMVFRVVVLSAGRDRVFPISEKVPADVYCHIDVPVGDFCLEELLTSSYKVNDCLILLLAKMAQFQNWLLVYHVSHIIFTGQPWSAISLTSPGQLGGLPLAVGTMTHALVFDAPSCGGPHLSCQGCYTMVWRHITLGASVWGVVCPAQFV
eukprot:9496336-Ditylum_brightwellii.AAC.1